MAEEHFLNKYVKGEQKFVSEPWYNSDGDCIVYQTADEAVVADRIDEILTIYRSAVTDEAIGFKIKGVQGILNKFGYDGLAVNSEQEGTTVKSISIIALLLAAYEEGPLSIKRRSAYANALTPREFNSAIPVNEIMQSC
ncbi:MAG: hypothetical protein FVQ80_11000 [Planctomycetes bacterium]|nr:hypothetical protein [Planctomycetota bacterium]